jgi:hypothetical protein
MQRTSFILLLAVIVYCVGAPGAAAAAEEKCTSVQAKCAVEIGGICDTSTGHWAYGRFQSHLYGGNTAMFNACLERNGHAPVAPRTSAAGNSSKCSSIQAQCAVEIGGRCNPRTGFWCAGFYRNMNCGGTNIGGAFDQCLSRKLREQKAQSR